MAEAEAVDPRDYLATLAFGAGPATQPHVWETPRRTAVSGALIWACKFCKRMYRDDRENETCSEHPSIVVRPGGS